MFYSSKRVYAYAGDIFHRNLPMINSSRASDISAYDRLAAALRDHIFNYQSLDIDISSSIEMTTMDQPDWSTDLMDSVWFHIGSHLTMEDLDRLSHTCTRLHHLFNSNDFWSYLIRARFGSAIWQRFIKRSSICSESEENTCRSKAIYASLVQRHCISLADFDRISLDHHRNYQTIPESSSLIGYVLQIQDSIEFCYSIQIETVFENILPGRYDVIWRMKLNLPYFLGETEFFAIPEQENPTMTAYTRWTQEDFLAMYRCFHCDLTDHNLWFYQEMGTVEIHGDQPCNVHVSMINQDTIHAKYGLFLDFVELKLRLD